MPMIYYHTDNWIINSDEALIKFLAFAIDRDGNINRNLKGQKVLLIESSLILLADVLSHLIVMGHKIDLTFVVFSNNKPQWVDPKLRTHIDEVREW